jgi:hypothetical protein
MGYDCGHPGGTGHPHPGQRKDKTNNQTLPSPSDKRPLTGHTVDLVAHHVLSSGTFHPGRDSVRDAFFSLLRKLTYRITRAFLIEEATIVKRVLKAKTAGKK